MAAFLNSFNSACKKVLILILLACSISAEQAIAKPHHLYRSARAERNALLMPERVKGAAGVVVGVVYANGILLAGCIFGGIPFAATVLTVSIVFVGGTAIWYANAVQADARCLKHGERGGCDDF